jgi:hypothetical protein
MSGERGGESVGPSRPIQLLGTVALRARHPSSDQWMELRHVEQGHLAAGVTASGGHRMQLCRQELPVTVLAANKDDSIVLLHMTPHLTFTSKLCGSSGPHFRMLCLFTVSETWKETSSENKTFVRQWGVSAGRFKRVNRQNCVAVACAPVSARAESAPCTQRDNRFRRSLFTVDTGICSFREAWGIYFLCLRTKSIRTFSVFSSERNCRPPPRLFKRLPVSRNLLCHALILFVSGVAFC